MSVCRYFQTNSCRFGNKCRFRHVYEDEYEPSRGGYDTYSYTDNKPSGVSVLQRARSNTSCQASSSTSYPSRQPSISENVGDISLTKHEIREAFKAVDRSGIWPFSCFSIVSTHGNVPGFEDVSPEELRLKAYIAQASGSFQSYISEVQGLLNKIKELKEVLLKRGPQAEGILRDFVKQSSSKNIVEPFPSLEASSSFSFNLASNPAFMGQQEPLSTNIFGQIPQKFPAQSTPFGQSSPSFGQSAVFDPPHNGAFQSTPQTSVFGQPSGTNELFSKNIFGQVFNSVPQSGQDFVHDVNVFAKKPSSNTFGVASQATNISLEANSMIYSDVDSLTHEEIEQFKATTFSYGKVPSKPPPKELC